MATMLTALNNKKDERRNDDDAYLEGEAEERKPILVTQRMHDNFVRSIGLPNDIPKLVASRPIVDTDIKIWWKGVFAIKRLPVWMQWLEEKEICESSLLEGIKTNAGLLSVLKDQ
eukprot:1683754-Karenia_brevis.AAC.1